MRAKSIGGDDDKSRYLSPAPARVCGPPRAPRPSSNAPVAPPQQAERGYDTFWMAEHHFQPEGTELIPNLSMMAMICAASRRT
jgi:alkanesulfonate monooxygenase SsuD/methylene tetrahydromethanopterin reductase-like flavin-dependent oxidoreductase (luciferase family)